MSRHLPQGDPLVDHVMGLGFALGVALFGRGGVVVEGQRKIRAIQRGSHGNSPGSYHGLRGVPTASRDHQPPLRARFAGHGHEASHDRPEILGRQPQTDQSILPVGIDAELQRNISMAYYDAGHMMYIHEPSLARLKQDLAGFVDATLGAA